MAWKIFKGKDGKKIGVTGKDKDGKSVTLLNPNGKGKKYAAELKRGTRFTNDGKQKTTKSGKKLSLSNTQKAYRSGYLQARVDNAKAFNARKAKRANKSK